ncbi:MAG: S41 family peptidase [Bacteroidales bacterium]
MIIDIKNRVKRGSILLLLLLTIFAGSCKKEAPSQGGGRTPDPFGVIKEYILYLMNNIYYWNNEVPQNINPKSFNSVEGYFDALLAPVDHWSWMMTGEEYLSSETGIVKSYGASFGQAVDYYNDYKVRVRFVHPNSPFANNGVKRGYIISKINGVPVEALLADNGKAFFMALERESNSFTFINYNGEELNFETSAEIIHTRSQLKTEIYGPGDFNNLNHNVGYFHYLSFKGGMLSDIDEAMEQFKNASIKELILDMRYNGGGDGQATQLLANYIAPASAEGKLIAKREHNTLYRSWDNDPLTSTVIKRSENSLNLDRLYILTSRETASASEVILNGFKPLMDVVQVGGTSYGKPNGMYVYAYPQGNYNNPLYIFLPICFFTVNSVGEGHYVNGIEPDHSRPDDLYHNFGVEEDWVQAVLTHIVTSQFPPLPVKAHTTREIESKTERLTLPLPHQKAGYGQYLFRGDN